METQDNDGGHGISLLECHVHVQQDRKHNVESGVRDDDVDDDVNKEEDVTLREGSQVRILTFIPSSLLEIKLSFIPIVTLKSEGWKRGR